MIKYKSGSVKSYAGVVNAVDRLLGIYRRVYPMPKCLQILKILGAFLTVELVISGIHCTKGVLTGAATGTLSGIIGILVL